MPPYNPPAAANYTESSKVGINVDIKSFIGIKGENLKLLTKKLNVQYIWFDFDRKVFEIWGPEKYMRRARNRLNKLILE